MPAPDVNIMLVFSMGCHELQISPTGQIMIHNASGVFQGDYNDMELGADILKNINSSIANAYEIKTGKPHAELLKMMNNETWLTAQKALELGFVDKIMFSDEAQFKNEVKPDSNGLLPKAVIEKMRNQKDKILNVENIMETLKKPEIDNEVELAKAKLKLEITL